MKERLTKFWFSLKPVLVIGFWAACVGGVIVLFSASVKRQNAALLQNITIRILDEQRSAFIDESDIRKILLNDRIAVHEDLDQIDIHHLEKELSSNPYLENGEVYIDAL